MALKRPELDKRDIVEVPWAQFLDAIHAEWEQGQHITGLGRTGGGKTTAMAQILDDRRFVFAFLTKRDDDLFPLFRKRGYHMVKDTEEIPAIENAPKVALHVKPEGLGRGAVTAQAATLRQALHKIWEQGGWTIYLDEIVTMTDLLKMDVELRAFWKEARSSKISIVAATQRPSRIPLEAYSQARFILLWRTNERRELLRLADMNGVDPEPVRQCVAQLDRFEILAVDTLTGDLARTRPPPLK